MATRSFSQIKQPNQRVFTASEIAEYDYCARVWWYEQYEPLVKAETDVLFAQLVKMEKDYGRQAVAIPEYQVIEQVLLRRGAFEVERDATYDQLEQDELKAEIEEEQDEGLAVSRKMHYLKLLAVSTLTLGLLFLLIAWVTSSLF